MQGACFQKLLPWCEPLWGSLRAKFITVIVLVQLSVMGLVTIVIEHRQRETILLRRANGRSHWPPISRL